MDGFIPLLKPPGITSHDVVDFTRCCVGLRRVGHGGTLDPPAAGVLPVAVGRATRLLEFLLGGVKEYRAEIILGRSTSTGDSWGAVMEERNGPEPSPEGIEAILASMVGLRRQRPPMVSAVRSGGRRLYQLAAEGLEVEREERTIRIYSLDLVTLASGSERGGKNPRITVDVSCSRGTYVRVLAEEVAERLGWPGHLSFLIRTRVGPFRHHEALTLEELDCACRTGRPGGFLHPPGSILNGWPALSISGQTLERFLAGNRIPTGGPEVHHLPGERSAPIAGEGGGSAEVHEHSGLLAVYDPGGSLVGVAEQVATEDGPAIAPRKIFPPLDGA
ncbi:MAG: tRNA pseudouridine(55) synthase TruB [Firmicutes bacterium]|nr:tRNA pseudouridine(55) synthase TruB [Bacillota bacterium]